MHLKRQNVPKQWGVARKGTTYVVRPLSHLYESVPLLVFLRDLLGVAKNRSEVKQAIHEKTIMVNDRAAYDEKQAILLFDKVALLPQKKYYKLNLSEYGKFFAEEIKENESHQKIVKVMNKKTLKKKRVQVNLSDGRNALSSLSCAIDDSVRYDFSKRTIVECLPLKKGARAIIIAGKHTGKRGTILALYPERKMAEVKTSQKTIMVLLRQLMVVLQ